MAAVDLLLDEAAAAGSAVLGFMGGEPFQNRKLVRAVTQNGRPRRPSGAACGSRFSITTNATLLTDDDCAHSSPPIRFTVAVSLDGPAAVNDRSGLTARDGGSYQRALAGLRTTASAHGAAHVSIRATVTPRTGPLLPILEDLLALGAARGRLRAGAGVAGPRAWLSERKTSPPFSPT